MLHSSIYPPCSQMGYFSYAYDDEEKYSSTSPHSQKEYPTLFLKQLGYYSC